MSRQLTVLIISLLVVTLSSVVTADIFYDDFNTPWNYLPGGNGLGNYDGVINTAGAPGSIQAMNADTNLAGRLYLASINCFYEPPFIPLGPFLYKTVQTKNWLMMVHLTDYPMNNFWNMHGIMARASMSPDQGGTGEDELQASEMQCIPSQFDVQDMNDGAQDFDFWAPILPAYVRMSKSGNNFAISGSVDGLSWLNHPWNTWVGRARRGEKSDIGGLNLQLGMFQCNYTATTEAPWPYGGFDDFYIFTQGPGQAWYQSPLHGTGNFDLTGKMYWEPDSDVKPIGGHRLFLSQNSNPRTEAAIVLDVNYYQIPSLLKVNKKYYWCVDEVNIDNSVTQGDIWYFTSDSCKARLPIPADELVDVIVTLPQLQWLHHFRAIKQDVYFGTDYVTVRDAAHDQAQKKDINGDVNTCNVSEVAPTWPLIPMKTYYWRIDTNVGAAGVGKGDVWSFITRYRVHPCDDFSGYWNFLQSGTTGTEWDGLIGIENPCLQMVTTTADGNLGHLYIYSCNACWSGNDHGILLYKEIAGNFIASIEVTDMSGLYPAPGHPGAVATNTAGLMARVGDLDAAGPGEDWISGDFFPGFGVGNIFRSCDDGGRNELGNEQTGWNGGRYLQIERRGARFYYRHSTDNVVWIENPASPITRDDMNGLPLQVGPIHSTCSATPAYVEYDDFCYGRAAIDKAHSPLPYDGDGFDKMRGKLSWLPGDYTPLQSQQHLFFGTDPNDLHEEIPPITGPDPVSGRFSYDISAVETLNIGQTYYWCVNEVNGAFVVKGDKWRFDVLDYTMVEDYEKYTKTGGVEGTIGYPVAGELRNTWIDGYRYPSNTAVNGGFAQLNTDTYDGIYDANNVAQGGAQSMHFYYDNDADGLYEWLALYGYAKPTCTVKYSEAMAAIDNAARLYKGPTWFSDHLGMKRDWSGYKLLKISFYGDPANTKTATDKLYVGLVDGDHLGTPPADGTVWTVSHPDPNILQLKGWHDWYIKLSDFSSQGINLTKVARICVGVGTRGNPQPGGRGAIFIDNIKLYASIVVIGDLNNDGKINVKDLQIMCSEWLTGGVLADIYVDDIVDFKDLAVLSDSWLLQCND